MSVETERIALEHRQLQAPASPMPGSLPIGRLYMTGDLRALTGLPRTHMDFYLREGIIQPTTRTGSGYLLFDHAELETLRAVLRWRDEGVGIREIRYRLGRPASH
jgi:DNA-binding transcriptional MerR regulator